MLAFRPRVKLLGALLALSIQFSVWWQRKQGTLTQTLGTCKLQPGSSLTHQNTVRKRSLFLPLSVDGEAGAAGAEKGTKDGGKWVLVSAFR